MNRIIISNAFSLGMLNREDQDGSPSGYTRRHDIDPGQMGTARVPRPCPAPQALLADADRFNIPVHSIVGHQSTADIFTDILDRPIACNRETLTLTRGDVLLVGQYVGPRLPEGATTLPEGARIEWWTV